MSLSQSALFDLVTQLTGRDNKIIVDVAFVHFCGDDLPAAVFLSQLIYWTPRAKLAGGWIAKKKEDWYAETCLSPYLIRKATELFEKRGFLETDRRKFGGAPTVHFRMNREKFMEQFIAFLTKPADNQNFDERASGPDSDNQNFDEPRNVKNLIMETQNFEEPYTDTTNTETTTDTTSGGPAKAGHGRGKSSVSKSSTIAPHTGGVGAARVPTRKAKEPAEKHPIYTQAVDVFFKAHIIHMGGAVVKFGKVEGKQLKDALAHIQKADGGQTWEQTLATFAGICAGWPALDKWYQGKFSTSIILNKLDEIISKLRTGFKELASEQPANRDYDSI